MQAKQQNLNDQELVKLSLESPYNFAYIMERYQGKLNGYLRKISNLSADTREDLLQEIFIKIYQNLNDYDKDLKFSSWIYRITHNHLIDYIRKEKKKLKISIDKHQLNQLLSHKKDISKTLANQECWEKVKFIIENKLKIKYKEVLILRFIEEKSYSEIMDILALPKGTIATRIKRGKKYIEKELKKANILCL